MDVGSLTRCRVAESVRFDKSSEGAFHVPMEVRIGPAVSRVHIERAENFADRYLHEILYEEIVLTVKQNRIEESAETRGRHAHGGFERHEAPILVANLQLGY